MDVSGIGLESLLGRYGVNASRSVDGLDAATDRLIKDKDQDGNGTLSAVEISISEEGFKRADADANGELDAGELKNAAGATPKGMKPHGHGGGLGRDDDDDEDDEDENTDVASLMAAFFQQADTNGDGVLSLEELQAEVSKVTEGKTEQKSNEPKGSPSVEEKTERLVNDRDQDGDGALSNEELPISSETFDAADTNKDGVLSFDELIAAGESIAEELRPEGAPPQRPFESLFQSQPADDSETTLDQVA
jgi:Ca2+-binding EF-hand superfamily protein